MAKKDKIVTDALTRKAQKIFRKRSEWWYMNDRDVDDNVEGMRDTLNEIMPEIRKALFEEFQAEQEKKANQTRFVYKG